MEYVSQMTSRWADSIAQKTYRIPSLLLMENAGIALAHHARLLAAAHGRSCFLVIAGKGNNAGDGFVAARHLHNLGSPVTVLLTSPPGAFPDESDPALNLRILATIGVERFQGDRPDHVRAAWGAGPSPPVFIDALFGTGLRGDLRPPYPELIGCLAAFEAPIVSADLPSGLDGDSGAVHGAAVGADVTVTFGFAKVGLARGEGPRLAGRVTVADISLPAPLKREIRAHRLETP